MPRVDTISKRPFSCSVEARLLFVEKKETAITDRHTFDGIRLRNSRVTSLERTRHPALFSSILPARAASHLSLGADEGDHVDVEVPFPS